LAQSEPATGGRGYAAVAVVAAVIFLCTAADAAKAEPAARAQFVFGNVTLLKADGRRVVIQRGSELDIGETIVTGANGRVHLRFTDGGYVSLTPNAELRLDDYRYSGRPDGNERIAMQFLKGGLRTVSGAIGSVAQSAYEMATRVATIGIRGTEYTLLYLPRGGLTGTVASGRIEVCNSGGCLEIAAGKSFLVVDQQTKPVPTERAADLGTPPPDASSLADATTPASPAGDQVDLSFRTVQSLAPPSGSPGGDPTRRTRGIGYDLVGVNAPEVGSPVGGLVSDFLHQGNNPGNAWGAGGNPNRGGPK
jgi:hypothetical protein